MVRGAWHRLVGPHQLRTGGQTKSARTGTSRGDRDPGPHSWWAAGFIYPCQRDFGSGGMDGRDADRGLLRAQAQRRYCRDVRGGSAGRERVRRRIFLRRNPVRMALHLDTMGDLFFPRRSAGRSVPHHERRMLHAYRGLPDRAGGNTHCRDIGTAMALAICRRCRNRNTHFALLDPLSDEPRMVSRSPWPRSDAAGPADRPSGGRGPALVAVRPAASQIPARMGRRPIVLADPGSQPRRRTIDAGWIRDRRSVSRRDDGARCCTSLRVAFATSLVALATLFPFGIPSLVAEASWDAGLKFPLSEHWNYARDVAAVVERNHLNYRLLSVYETSFAPAIAVFTPVVVYRDDWA